MVNFRLDKKSPVPFYQQLIDMILAGISSAAIAPGDRLPTIRDMAVKLEVNPNTVVKAYTQLQLLGVLDTQQGSGVFVRAQAEGFQSKAEKKRVLEELCHDFVGRAQLLGIGLDNLIDGLQHMRTKKGDTAAKRETGKQRRAK